MIKIEMTELNLCLPFNFILKEFRMSKKESNSLALHEVSLDNSMVFRQKETRSDFEKLPQTD